MVVGSVVVTALVIIALGGFIQLGAITDAPCPAIPAAWRYWSQSFAPQPEQREVIRLLYVATRHQVKALAACSGLEGLE